MHAVLPALRLGHALEDKRRSDPFFGNEHRDRCIGVVVAIVERGAPEVGQLRRIGTVENEIYTRLLTHRVPPCSVCFRCCTAQRATATRRNVAEMEVSSLL